MVVCISIYMCRACRLTERLSQQAQASKDFGCKIAPFKHLQVCVCGFAQSPRAAVAREPRGKRQDRTCKCVMQTTSIISPCTQRAGHAAGRLFRTEDLPRPVSFPFPASSQVPAVPCGSAQQGSCPHILRFLRQPWLLR